MTDRWAIVHRDGELHLNDTFHSVGIYPGATPTVAAARHASNGGYVRIGDGLRTPGAIALTGRLWSDERDWVSLREELVAIEAAVRSSIALVRYNANFEYTYANLSGGPTIEVYPDGLSGFRLRLEFWPGRADANIAPILSGDDLVPIPPSATYRLVAYETWGSTIADLSEWWLGTASVNRFPGAPTTSKSAGGNADQLVNGLLSDSANQSGLPCWWEIEYPAAHQLAYLQVARPNSTVSRRLRTWAVRIPHPSALQQVTVLTRGNTDDMSAALTYAPFDLAGKLVQIEPLFGNTTGTAGAQGTAATINVARPSRVEQNDLILFLAGALDGADAPQVITPPPGTTAILNNPGLFIGYRFTSDHATEPANYAFGNPNGTGFAVVTRTIHNADVAAPIAGLGILNGTPAAPVVSVVPKNAIIVAALYPASYVPTPSDLPVGFDFLMQLNRTSGAAGQPKVVAGFRNHQDVGSFNPGNFGGTPLTTVTFTMNPTRPIA